MPVISVLPFGMIKAEMTVKNGNVKNYIKSLLTGAVIPVAIVIGLSVSALSVSAADLSVTARAGISERFNRFVFEWPFAVPYTADQQGNSVTVTFSKPAKINFSAIDMQSMKFVRNLSQSSSGDKVTVKFTVPADAQVQSFTLGTKIVVDVLKNTQAPVTFTAQKPSVADKGKIAEQGNVTERAEKIKKELMVARAGAVKPVSPENNKIPGTPPIAETGTLSPNSTVSAAEVVKVKELPPLPDSKLGAVPGVIPGPEKFANKSLFTVRPAEKTRMAAFTRAGFLWVVFDRVLSDVPPEMEGGLMNEMKPLMRFNVEGGTAFRLSWPFAAGSVNIVPKRDNMTWQLAFVKNDAPMVSIAPEIDYVTDPQKPAVVLRTVEKPGKVMIEDPEIGDSLFVVTVFNDKISSVGNNRYPEFRLIPAELGVVVSPMNENVVMATTEDGVSISGKGRMTVSDESDLRSRAPKETLRRNRRMFDLVGWQAGKREFFGRNRRMIERKIIGLEGVAKASGYVDLAKLLVANGLGYEASGALKVAHGILPDLENSPDFRAILGASKALSYRHADALQDLTFDKLQGQPEILLWTGFAYAGMEEWKKAAENFDAAENVLDTYPDRIKIKILTAKVKTYLETGNIIKAAENITLLKVMPSLYPTDKAAYNYLSGRLLAANGDFAGAEKMLRAAMDIKDRFYGVTARHDYYNALYAQEKISAEKAAEKFETIRFSWRGDENEIRNLHRLGKLYLEAAGYSQGLSVLREAFRLSKSEDRKEKIVNDMKQSFNDLFVKGESDSLPPVEALSVFNDFRELLPQGSDGIISLKRLAERMVEVDLLDKAAALLENLIRYHVKDKESVEVGTRLAVIRLLDHKPEAALKALDETEKNDKTGWDNLVAERLLLRARALSDIGKTDEALALLANENNVTAMGLKTDINWRAGRWAAAASVLEQLIDYDLQNPEKDNLESMKEQSDRVVDFVLQRGIALALAGDAESLKNLYADYEQLMKGTDSEAAFAVVVRQAQSGSLADIETLTTRVNEVALFDDFLKKYKSIKEEKAKAAEITAAAAAAEKEKSAAAALKPAVNPGDKEVTPKIAAETATDSTGTVPYAAPSAAVDASLPPPPPPADATKEIKP